MNWTGKKVLVTGAGGFIGSHLAEELVRQGANVRAFVHYNAFGSWGWLDESNLKKDMEVVAGDITDRGSVDRAASGMDVFFHLAALIAIPYSYTAPYSYVNTNINGTLNVLEAGRHYNVEKIVHTSTSEVYGTAQYVPIDEAHPQVGQSPYSATKIGADKLAQSFHLSFNLPVVTVRPFNTFGPRQSARAVIPTIISQCLSNSASLRLGNLTPTRDLNFVSNTVEGFLAAASIPEAIGKTINLGSGREISIGELAGLIIRQTGRNLEILPEDIRYRPEKSEVERLLANNQLAKSLLKWEPRKTLEEGLELTIAWMQTHLERYRPNVYTI